VLRELGERAKKSSPRGQFSAKRKVLIDVQLRTKEPAVGEFDAKERPVCD
jgi:hypothetical protein